MTEAQLATFFQKCGKVKDCRVCGDPNSAMRFAFIEFEKESAAKEVTSRQYLHTLPELLQALQPVSKQSTIALLSVRLVRHKTLLLSPEILSFPRILVPLLRLLGLTPQP